MVMGGFRQLLGSVGIHGAGEGILGCQMEQVFHAQVAAGIVTAGFLGSDIISVIVFLRCGFI